MSSAKRQCDRTVGDLPLSVTFTDVQGDTSTIQVAAEAVALPRPVSVVRCADGHDLGPNAHQARLTANCDGCGATGTEQRCQSGCDYDLCARCCAAAAPPVPAGGGPVRRLSWHSGGRCYLEAIGILEYDEVSEGLGRIAVFQKQRHRFS